MQQDLTSRLGVYCLNESCPRDLDEFYRPIDRGYIFKDIPLYKTQCSGGNGDGGIE